MTPIQEIQNRCDKLKQKYEWAFMSNKPVAYQMLVDINDLKYLIETLSKIEKYINNEAWKSTRGQ